MTRTYDTHCPVCRTPVTVKLDGDPDTVSGYWIGDWPHGWCACDQADDDWMEAWAERCDELESREPGWWDAELERQQLARNIVTGLQGALL